MDYADVMPSANVPVVVPLVSVRYPVTYSSALSRKTRSASLADFTILKRPHFDSSSADSVGEAFSRKRGRENAIARPPDLGSGRGRLFRVRILLLDFIFTVR
jgi:hypothetical protein